MSSMPPLFLKVPAEQKWPPAATPIHTLGLEFHVLSLPGEMRSSFQVSLHPSLLL